MGSVDLKPVSCEITYGLERIAMFIQKKKSIFDIEWNKGVTYGDIRLRDEVEFSNYNFKLADPPCWLTCSISMRKRPGRL